MNSRRSILGAVGLSLLGHREQRPSGALAHAATPKSDWLSNAISALRATNVPPNPDGSYNMVTARGNVVRVTGDA